mgnify:CR=1 FL=1
MYRRPYCGKSRSAGRRWCSAAQGRDHVRAADEDLSADLFTLTRELLCDAGLPPYEVSNHAGPGRESRHNLTYWRGGDYHGLGPSATGYVRGGRTANIRNTTAYCEILETGRRAVDEKEELSPLKRAGEIAAFGLRMNAGWPYAEFENVTGFDLKDQWAKEISELVDKGQGICEVDSFRLTPRGLRLADAIGAEFLR